jgi:hypothetical protein
MGGEKMLKGLFKKKITVKEASGILVTTILESCKQDWEEDKKALMPFLDKDMDEETLEYVPFEIAIALASMELQVVRNVSPEFATEVYENILDMMAFGEWKDYVIETLSMEYLPHMQKAIRDNENPLEKVVQILADKIQFDLNIVSGLELMKVIGTKIRFWRTILDNYKVVRG